VKYPHVHCCVNKFYHHDHTESSKDKTPRMIHCFS